MILETEYKYSEKKIVVPEAENLDEIVPPEGEYRYAEVPAGFDVDGEEVFYQIVLDNASGKIARPDFKYVFVTACIRRGDDLIALGIKDNDINDSNVSWGRSTIWKRGGEFPRDLLSQIPGDHSESRGIPWPDIRLNDGSDTFFVREEYRGKGIGKALFFTALELSKRLGAFQHVIMTGEDSSTQHHADGVSFYSQFVPLTDGWAWVFPLAEERE